MEERRPWSLSRWAVYGLAALGLGPFLLSLYGSPRIPDPRPIDSHKAVASLAFRQYSVNLREIPATGRVTVPFPFWNRGSQTLKIVKLEPSCGCLAPVLLGKKEEYIPRAQGLFEVKVDIAREPPGPHEYSILVHYDDGEPRQELVTFRMVVPEHSVQVTPSELYFYQVSEGPLNAEIRVADHRGKNLKVKDVRSSSPQLKLEIQEQTADDKGTVIPIKVSVNGRLANGSNSAVVSIRTDDPDFPTIQVPVFLHGRPDGVQLTAGELPVGRPLKKEAAVIELKPREENNP